MCSSNSDNEKCFFFFNKILNLYLNPSMSELIKSICEYPDLSVSFEQNDENSSSDRIRNSINSRIDHRITSLSARDNISYGRLLDEIWFDVTSGRGSELL